MSNYTHKSIRYFAVEGRGNNKTCRLVNRFLKDRLKLGIIVSAFMWNFKSTHPSQFFLSCLYYTKLYLFDIFRLSYNNKAMFENNDPNIDVKTLIKVIGHNIVYVYIRTYLILIVLIFVFLTFDESKWPVFLNHVIRVSWCYSIWLLHCCESKSWDKLLKRNNFKVLMIF